MLGFGVRPGESGAPWAAAKVTAASFGGAGSPGARSSAPSSSSGSPGPRRRSPAGSYLRRADSRTFRSFQVVLKVIDAVSGSVSSSEGVRWRWVVLMVFEGASGRPYEFIMSSASSAVVTLEYTKNSLRRP